MRKKLVSALLCIAMVAVMVVGCSSSSSDDASDEGEGEETEAEGDEAEASGDLKIGITIQSLTNDYWASVMSKLEDEMDAKGYEYTLIDCEDNSATQISQIENFITDGCDVIMVHPSDPDAVESVCAEALDAGIKVMCWDDTMENTTSNWVLDNTDLGNAIGSAAATWGNGIYEEGETVEVCVIGYPSTKILLERQNGIEAGLEENADFDVDIVAEIDGLEANDAQMNVETVLQAHPDCRLFVGVGAGAMIGANEALLQTYGGAGNIPEDVGVITTDVTPQQLDSLQAGDEAVRAIIGFEGSSVDTAKACLDMIEKTAAATDSDFQGDDHDVYRPTMTIDVDNIDEIQEGM